ncbi:3430_t:CDS:2 [Funneliformis caledonium]|uniref:3430_t:CDS:1 n=1 Tax=Funneliformis caledonium TaxID=1117310 RepID=A0A9N8ZSK4_9GLOM|nr:3430_t:CDS:2 [Funneliformis caledonium]
MPNLKLNDHHRWLIVERILEGLSCRIIARQFNISKSSVPEFLYILKSMEPYISLAIYTNK